jgi:PAS domain S-box-containing protein
MEAKPSVLIVEDDADLMCSLTNTHEALHALMQASPLAIVTLDRNARVTMWNRAAEQIFGWSEAEVLGAPFPALPEDSRPVYEANVSRVLTGEVITDREEPCRKKTGELIDVRLSSTPLRDSKGDVIGTMSMMEDITKGQQLEAQLLQSHRMEAVGRLAGGIAHEFKNLLMGVSGYAEIVQMKLGRSHPLFDTTNDLLNCVDRASKLIGHLQTFSRRQAIDACPTDLNALVLECKYLLERLLGEHIALRLDLAPKPCMVNVDRGQIEQAIVNLAINARDAMPQGGELTICTKRRRYADTGAASRHGVKPGKYIELSVTDTGMGMDEETQDRMFEPFFTTKDTGERTGLGLAVTYGIIKQHKGHIAVSSKIGKGTTFKVYLPMIRSEAAGKDHLQPPQPRGGAETILLAEDEDIVRTPLKAVLEDYGYTVLCASDGKEAAGLFKRHADKVDLAILDLVMPKAGGKYVWQAIREVRPDVKVLFISGHSAAAVHEDFKPPKELTYLSKPFSMLDLAAKIRELLD